MTVRSFTRRAFIEGAALGFAAVTASAAVAESSKTSAVSSTASAVSSTASTVSSTASTASPTTARPWASGSASDPVSDLAWWQKTIVYETYPKSFLDTASQGTGTIAGITGKLDYLASLGVGAVWLTPVYRSPMVDGGYDVADYRDIDPRFGTMADMDELIAKAGEKDIRIIMDLVFNHTSDQCAWFLESKASKDGDKADWYIWRDAKKDGSAPTNWRGIFGGSAWEWCDERQQYYLHTFATAQPDLNWENPDVRQALYDIANFWLQKGVGGFRVDAITYIKKPATFADGTPDASDGMCRIHDATANTEGILDFLNEFKRNVIDGHDIVTVAEANGVTDADLPLWVGSNGVFNMVFGFDHFDVVAGGGAEAWCRASDWKLSDLKRALTGYQTSTASDGWCPVFFENHDQPRSVNNFFAQDIYGEKVAASAASSVAGASGAAGASGVAGASSLTTDAAAKALAMVLFTLRGTPFVYQGEELGYANVTWDSIDDYEDVKTRDQYRFALAEGFSEAEAMDAVHRFSRDNARTPMQWDTSEYAGFSDVRPWLPVHDDYPTCNVDVQCDDQDSVFRWYRTLVDIRNAHPELIAGDYEELLPDDEQIYAYERTLGNVTATVLVNFSNEDAVYDASLIDGAKRIASTREDAVADTLRPLEAALYERHA